MRGFDPAFGCQFSTYAVPKIAGEIRRFLRDDGAVKVSRGLKERAGSIRTARDRLSARLGREPTLSELSEETGLEPEEIAAICGRNKVDRVILEITEEHGPATLGKRLKAAMLLRRQNREICVELLLDNKRWPGLYAEAKDCLDRGVVSELYLTDLTTTLVETLGVERHGRWLSWLLFFAKRAEKSDDTTDAKRRRAAMEKK